MSEQTFQDPTHPGAQQGVLTPAEAHTRTLADPATPAIQAEVLAETGPQPVKTVTVALGSGVDVQVPLMTEWRSSALDFMRAGDFDSWAESVLAEGDLDAWDEWMASDPKLGDLQEFMASVGKATGAAAGGNRASRRALQRTQKR